MLHGFVSQKRLHDDQHTLDSFILRSSLPKLLLKAAEEVSFLLVRYVVASCITCSSMRQTIHGRDSFCESRSGRSHAWDLCVQDVIFSSRSITPLLKLYSSNFLPEDITVKTFTAFDLLEYFMYFALTWSQRNPEGLFLLMQPILVASSDSSAPDIKAADLKKNLYQTAELMFQDSMSDCKGDVSASSSQPVHNESTMLVVPDDEKWLLIGVCLWRHLANVSNGHLFNLMTEFDCSNISARGGPSWPSSSEGCQSDLVSVLKPIKLFPIFLAKLLRTTLEYVSSSLSKHLLSFLGQKVQSGLPVPILGFLEGANQPQPRTLHNILRQGSDTLKARNANGMPFLEILWEISVDLKDIRGSFVLEQIKWLRSVSHKLCNSWTDIHNRIMSDYENMDTLNHRVTNSGSAITETGSATMNRSLDSSIFLVNMQKDTALLREVCFQHPNEIYKNSGDLIEVNLSFTPTLTRTSFSLDFLFYIMTVNRVPFLLSHC